MNLRTRVLAGGDPNRENTEGGVVEHKPHAQTVDSQVIKAGARALLQTGWNDLVSPVSNHEKKKKKILKVNPVLEKGKEKAKGQTLTPRRRG